MPILSFSPAEKYRVKGDSPSLFFPPLNWLSPHLYPTMVLCKDPVSFFALLLLLLMIDDYNHPRLCKVQLGKVQTKIGAMQSCCVIHRPSAAAAAAAEMVMIIINHFTISFFRPSSILRRLRSGLRRSTRCSCSCIWR
jgi:hypothetical protein